MLRLQPVDDAAVRDLLAGLRESDAQEIRVMHRREPEDVLPTPVRESRVSTAAYDEGGLVCAFGVYEDDVALGRHGAPWLLCTDRVKRHRKALLRGTRMFLSDMLARYDRLENVVWAGHDEAVAFIRAQGFQLAAPEVTVYGAAYHRFWKDAEDVRT